MEDGRAVPYTPLSDEELKELAYAKALLENPGFSSKAFAYASSLSSSSLSGV